jgi:hypothetical protein
MYKNKLSAAEKFAIIEEIVSGQVGIIAALLNQDEQ